jgi:hypothetical protein
MIIRGKLLGVVQQAVWGGYDHERGTTGRSTVCQTVRGLDDDQRAIIDCQTVRGLG